MKICRMSKLISLIGWLFLLTSCKSINMKKFDASSYDKHVNMSGNNVLAACDEYLAKAQYHKDKLISMKDRPDAFAALSEYNEILIQLDSAMSQAGLLSNVHPSEALRKTAEVCEQKASKFSTELSLNEEVYNVIKKIDSTKLDQSSQRMLTQTIRGFKRSGVDKDKETRYKIRQLREELVIIGQEFGQNIRQERFFIELNSTKDLAGLPKDYIDSHKPDAKGKIAISTDYPDYIPFMQYANSNQYRKELRHKYLNRGQKNGPILESMINKRYELAKLLGYSSYADYIVEDKMIKTPKAVYDFIENISSLAKAGADKEYAQLLEYKKTTDKSAQKIEKIEGYESAFLEEGYKKEKFSFDSQEVRPYFSYEQVKQGVLDTTSELFGIKYVAITDAPVWHESVVVYDVYDSTSKLGRIYLDMHPREGKYQHAAQFTVKSGLLNRQYPEGALVCNFPRPSANDKHAFMEHAQVVTFFHEFGHLLHHTFAGRQNWMPFSGVATEWDFVEAPSQFLEEWAWSPEVLASFAKHYETKQPIKPELVNKMRAADEFGKAIAARQQMFYAALSVNYFDKDPKTFNTLAMLKDLQSQYSYFPYEEGTHFNYNFGHLEGYSAMYYTYMWSLSLAKDLLEPFKKNGLMDKATAQRFKEIILSSGGSKDAKDLVEEFLGRPAKFDAFKTWLTI